LELEAGAVAGDIVGADNAVLCIRHLQANAIETDGVSFYELRSDATTEQGHTAIIRKAGCAITSHANMVGKKLVGAAPVAVAIVQTDQLDTLVEAPNHVV